VESIFSEKMDYYVLTFAFLLYVQFSLEKLIDRYKAYTKGDANNDMTVHQDIQVYLLYKFAE
jgi:hypothetical protein